MTHRATPIPPPRHAPRDPDILPSCPTPRHSPRHHSPHPAFLSHTHTCPPDIPTHTHPRCAGTEQRGRRLGPLGSLATSAASCSVVSGTSPHPGPPPCPVPVFLHKDPLMPPRSLSPQLGVHGYAFLNTNNGYILSHPDLRPLVGANPICLEVLTVWDLGVVHVCVFSHV